MVVLAFVGDDEFVDIRGATLDVLAAAAGGEGAFVVAAGVGVAFDGFLPILAPSAQPSSPVVQQDILTFPVPAKVTSNPATAQSLPKPVAQIISNRDLHNRLLHA
jgi:hypothetical protein